MSNVLAVDHQLAPHNGDRASSDPGQEVSGSAGNRPLEQHDSGMVGTAISHFKLTNANCRFEKTSICNHQSEIGNHVTVPAHLSPRRLNLSRHSSVR